MNSKVVVCYAYAYLCISMLLNYYSYMKAFIIHIRFNDIIYLVIKIIICTVCYI